MKKIFGIALVLALIVTLGFSSVALADGPQNVHTEWDFDGEGEINIHTWKSFKNVGEDHLYVESLGSGSSGWQNITVIPAPTSGSYTWSGSSLQLDRQVWVEDGSVETWMVRDNSSWAAYTEYRAYLDVDSAGYLEQHFSNSYFAAHMNTDIWANGSYEMRAMTEGWTGGYFFFGIGAEGDGEGNLWLNTTDYAEHNGTRCLQGNFYEYADPASAGFEAEWDNEAIFGGSVETPDITEYFNVDVNGSGEYSTGASADWVIIEGFINGGQYVGMN